MDPTALVIWQSFLQTSPAQQQASLMHYISSELADQLNALATTSFHPKDSVIPLEEELMHIHTSWLAPFLRSLSEHEIKLFLSCLSLEQIKHLKQSLLLTNTLPVLSNLGKDFLKKIFFKKIVSIDLLPIACLPQNPLNDLLELSFSELNSLIELLGMHDLSIEIRHIIETAKLKSIYSFLTKAQTTFLKTLLHKKEPVSFKKMGLLAWNGDKEALRWMLLQRGVNRIAKSLYDQSPSLLWYVSHRLDAEMGSLLIKLCTALDHPRAADILANQVIELMSALKTHNPPQNA